MSLLELFCHVDDFWLQFGPHWERERLARGATPTASRTVVCQRDHDHHDLFSSDALPGFQDLLHAVRAGLFAGGVSAPGELPAVRGIHTLGTGAAVCLPAKLLR